MDSNAFLAGLAVGRRLKGWACGGDLRVNIGTGGNDEKDEPYKSIIRDPLLHLLGEFSAIAVPSGPMVGDYEEGGDA